MLNFLAKIPDKIPLTYKSPLYKLNLPQSEFYSIQLLKEGGYAVDPDPPQPEGGKASKQGAITSFARQSLLEYTDQSSSEKVEAAFRESVQSLGKLRDKRNSLETGSCGFFFSPDGHGDKEWLGPDRMYRSPAVFMSGVSAEITWYAFCIRPACTKGIKMSS